MVSRVGYILHNRHRNYRSVGWPSYHWPRVHVPYRLILAWIWWTIVVLCTIGDIYICYYTKLIHF